MPPLPTTYVDMSGQANTTDFFAPATSPIAAISGTATRMTVTLQSGAILIYEGTGLSFAGLNPTGGTVTAVSLTNAAGVVTGRLQLTEAPWAFSDIATAVPLQSYLATGHVINDAYNGSSFIIDNLLSGGNESDTISLVGGADTVRGLGGDDVIALTSFSGTTRPLGTVIDGGSGVDMLLLSGQAPLDLRNVGFSSIEVVSLIGSEVRLSGAQFGNGKIAADLKITGGQGSVLQIDQVAGKAVNASYFQFDPLYLQQPTLKILGTAANDVQIGNDASSDRLEGFAGNDTLNGRDGNDTIFGGDGDDRLFAGGTSPGLRGSFRDEVYGGAGNDQLYGGSQTYSAEVLNGDAGNDTIVGGGYGSVMDGGTGDDLLRATSTTDDIFVGNTMLGGAGNDRLIGSSDYAEMYGGAGNDLYRVNGRSVLFEAVGEGTDRVITTVDLDLSVSGRFGGDAGEIERISVAGGVGRAIVGTATDNRIDGGIGADSLSGAGGNDQLFGMDGNDVLSGGTGNDVLRGGAGEDTFVFATGFGTDRVTDFTSGSDLIDLRGLAAVTSFADLMTDHARQVGSDVWIDAGAGDVLVLRNLTVTGLVVDDFLFL
jgi:serralysin